MRLLAGGESVGTVTRRRGTLAGDGFDITDLVAELADCLADDSRCVDDAERVVDAAGAVFEAKGVVASVRGRFACARKNNDSQRAAAISVDERVPIRVLTSLVISPPLQRCSGAQPTRFEDSLFSFLSRRILLFPSSRWTESLRRPSGVDLGRWDGISCRSAALDAFFVRGVRTSRPFWRAIRSADSGQERVPRCAAGLKRRALVEVKRLRAHFLLRLCSFRHKFALRSSSRSHRAQLYVTTSTAVADYPA